MQFQTFDDDYLRRLRDGDSQVEQHFASYFGELILLKLRRRVRTRQLMEDIRQETLCRVLRAARDKFFVGNLYLNRKCTGAMVGAHPFGGFNMSGTDSKAGGPDYLLLFTQAKSIGEKI